MDRDRVRKCVKEMRDGHYVMVLISMANNRSEREWQKYYRVLLKQMAEDTGYTPSEMHDFAKIDVLYPKLGLDSTTELDSIMWREYIEHLGDWSLEKFDFII